MLRYVVEDGHSAMKEPMKDKRIIPVERIILLCFIGPEYRGRNPLADCKGRALCVVQEQDSAGSKAEPGRSRTKSGRVTDEMPCPSR